MIEVLAQNPHVDREVVMRLARLKNIELTEHGIARVSGLARELIDLGIPIADAFDAALNHKFQLMP